MKLAVGLLLSTATALLNWSQLKTRGARSDLFQFFAWTGAAITMMFAGSLLLPDLFAQPAQEILGWCLAGSIAALALGAALRALDGLLEA